MRSRKKQKDTLTKMKMKTQQKRESSPKKEINSKTGLEKVFGGNFYLETLQKHEMQGQLSLVYQFLEPE